jgi:hypothetical protein
MFDERTELRVGLKANLFLLDLRYSDGTLRNHFVWHRLHDIYLRAPIDQTKGLQLFLDDSQSLLLALHILITPWFGQTDRGMSHES